MPVLPPFNPVPVIGDTSIVDWRTLTGSISDTQSENYEFFNNALEVFEETYDALPWEDLVLEDDPITIAWGIITDGSVSGAAYLVDTSFAEVLSQIFVSGFLLVVDASPVVQTTVAALLNGLVLISTDEDSAIQTIHVSVL